MNYPSCSICKNIGEYSEIEYEDGGTPPDFHTSYKLLQRPKYNNDFGLLVCPECGRFYLERSWTPGGSEDALKTYYN